MISEPEIHLESENEGVESEISSFIEEDENKKIFKKKKHHPKKKKCNGKF